jgi:hypothetical protein
MGRRNGRIIMDRTEWKASQAFYLKALTYILLFPAWAVWAALGRTDYTRFIRWISDRRPFYRTPSNGGS